MYGKGNLFKTELWRQLVTLGLDNLAQAENKNEYYYEMRRDIISLLS